MKAHVGVGPETKLIHSVAATAANVADARMLPALLHGAETPCRVTRPILPHPQQQPTPP